MAKDDREERLAAALRANLRRRKGQAREAVEAAVVAPDDDIGDQPPANDPAA